MIIMPVNMAGNRYRPPARYHRQNMTRHCMAVRGSDFWQGAKSRQQLTHDYMRHIVSHFAAERMKHVKQYLGAVLSNYRAGGPVRREYPHDAGMAGKTKATTEGSPVEIKEIKRLTNYAISVAGGQYAVYEECPLDPDVRIFLRHVLFRKSSSAKFFGTSLCSRARALSFLRINSLALAFSRTTFRLSSSSDMRLVASVTIEESDFVFWSSIVSSCIAIRRSSLHYGVDSFYPLGSMPRCCNSLRSIRFIQAARESSPSCCCAFSIFSRKSGSSRNWNGGLPRLSLLCVDTSITPHVMCLCVSTHYTHSIQKTTPRSAGVHAGRLTKSRSGVTIMAAKQHTPRHAYTQTILDALASYQPGGRDLLHFKRRGYFLINASSANRFGLVSGGGLSKDSRFWRAFSRWRSSMDNAISCSSSFVIVCTRKAKRRSTLGYSADGFCCCDFLRWFFLPLRNTSSGGGSLVFSGGVNFSFLVSMMARISRWRCSALMFGVTGEKLGLLILDSGNVLCRDASYHGAGYCLFLWYPSFPEGYVNILRTNFSHNTSDHLSKKAAYTEAIPYKTGSGRENPFNCKAINDARSVFFSASALRHINGVVYCAYSCTIQSFHELHFAQRHQQTMVMLAGLPKGRPESLQSGFLTPASVTALCERENSCGDVIHHCKEAANMATTPALVHSQTAFIWRFIIFGASESQIINVTAWTEREARSRCPSGCVAVFAARIRQEASHG